MNDSVYAPPKADLTGAGGPGSDGDNAFYVISIRKFCLLFFLTLGAFQIYYFYKNWSAYKDRARYTGVGDKDIWPVPRAIFSVFFIHSLFREVAAYASEKGRELNWNVDSNATMLVLLIIGSNACDRLSSKGIGGPLLAIIGLVLLLPLGLSFVNAQRQINTACGDPEGATNSNLTGANWAWMILGAMIWMLVLAGTFMPELADA